MALSKSARVGHSVEWKQLQWRSVEKNEVTTPVLVDTIEPLENTVHIIWDCGPSERRVCEKCTIPEIIRSYPHGINRILCLAISVQSVCSCRSVDILSVSNKGVDFIDNVWERPVDWWAQIAIDLFIVADSSRYGIIVERGTSIIGNPPRPGHSSAGCRVAGREQCSHWGSISSIDKKVAQSVFVREARGFYEYRC